MSTEPVEPGSGEPTEDPSGPAQPWSTFEAVPAPWPAALVAELEQWKQGDVVAGVPVTWVAPAGSDDVTGVENPRAESSPVTGSDFVAEYAVICSQTCDIGAASAPGMYHPFVLVAPLVPLSRVEPAEVRNLAKFGKVGWLFPTQSPDPSDDKERWFADLRLIVPVSKTLLGGRAPISGFEDEKKSLAFGEAIAQKFRRPALSETLSQELPRTVKKFIQDNGPKKQAFRKVEQVRLLVIDSSRLFPERAQLIVMMDSDLDEAEMELWRGLEQKVEPLFSAVGIDMVPMTFRSAGEMPASTYRVTVPIHCELLGFPSYP